MRTFLLLILLALAYGCGHKGPVVPIGEPLPVAPLGFSVKQYGSSLLLSWKVPTVNQDGSPIEKLEGFDILRMDFDGIETCDSCRDRSRSIRYIDMDYLEGASRRGDTISVVDSEIESPKAYRYHVVGVNKNNHRGARASLDVITLSPPQAPLNLSGEGLDRLVRLGWETIEPGEGETLLGYLVYRAEADKPFPQLPLQTKPVTENRYEDLGVANDVTLRYAVRTVVEAQGREVLSGLSNEIIITPRAGR